MMKRILHNIIFLLILFSFEGISQSIVINEVQYSNKNTIEDEDHDTSDWIELFNSSSETISLVGYKLTDDITEDKYWSFPNIELTPGNFLIIFASGKDKEESLELHTDFKLGLMKDPLFLINPDGDISDQINIQCVPPDMSLGRQPDGAINRAVLHPTPGYSNNEADQVSINYQPDSLFVSHPSGFYKSSFEIELTCNYSGNTIFYTLDGESPDNNSEIYEIPIYLNDLTNNENRFANIPETDFEPGNQIFKANIIRARVYSEGCPASAEITNTYFVNEGINKDYDIPIVSLITEKNNLFDEDEGIYVKGNHNNYNQHGKNWERPVHIEIFDNKHNQIIDQDCGIRIHGRGSRIAPQKSLRLYARNKYGKAYFEYPFFIQKSHLNKFKRLLLYRVNSSLSLFRDELCQHLVQDMEIDYSANQTALVFINGEYWGIYSLRERQDEYYVENNFAISNAEIDIISYNESLFECEEGTIDAYSELINYLQQSNPQSDNFYSEISKRIDLNAMMDFFIAQLYFANIDFPDNNYKLWKLESDTSRWRCFFFDLDQAMIRTNYEHISEYNNTFDDFQRFPEYSTFIFRCLMANKEFRDKFYFHFLNHLNSTFRSDKVCSAINDFEALYEPLVWEHIYRWNYPSNITKWKHDIGLLKLFALQRPDIINEQIKKNFGNPFVIYPNPSDGIFSIKFLGPTEEIRVSIFDIKGRMISNTILRGNEIYHVSTKLDSGIYFLNIQLGIHIYNEKLIIK